MPGRHTPIYNKHYRVKTLVDHFCFTFKHFVLPKLHMSVSKLVPPFRGQCNLKRYFPKKPKKCVRPGISSYVYQF